MNKNIIYIVVFVLLYSCGFEPLYKNSKTNNLNIQKINFIGNNEINYLVKNYLNIQENNNPAGLIINLSSKENTQSSLKNSSGVTIEEILKIEININVTNNKKNNILTDKIETSKILRFSGNMSSDEETKKIERDILIKSLVQKIKYKLFYLKDN